ncbi:NF-kappa-B inhibitor alpha-like [Mya arenaria]|nr:NF-kappa-B inhibitor alpha-like [Mya arenaria]XP_052792289.1 NF-kappa-B inhibitor alpha-like [Mya arenaria]XP_052792291.1 NF-kappa-B inhibitor alpha-like [Mya arenaria]
MGYPALKTWNYFMADSDGDTLLHIAIILCRSNIALLLIACAPTRGWLSQQNTSFQSPLHLAVLTDQPEMVYALFCAGADLLVQDANGNTPLHVAVRDGQIQMTGLILQGPHSIRNCRIRNYEGLTCVHLAANGRHVALVQLLVVRGADVNACEGKTGRTALHNACVSGDVAMVRALIRVKTCNLNARAYDGLTPFDLARAWGHEEVCTVLAAQGAMTAEDDSDF